MVAITMFLSSFCVFKAGLVTPTYTSDFSGNRTTMYLDVLMVREARRNTGQSVVVKVELSQVGNISQCAIFHRADLIVAETQSVEKKK